MRMQGKSERERGRRRRLDEDVNQCSLMVDVNQCSEIQEEDDAGNRITIFSLAGDQTMRSLILFNLLISFLS